MKYKIIEEDALKELYPNNYDTNQLKKYGLMDWRLNTSFRYYYSSYRYVLETYLNKVLHLDELDEQIKGIGKLKENHNLYQRISNLDLSTLYIRNNIFLDRFSEEEFMEFKDGYEKQDYTILENLVIKTYKKLIAFSKELGENDPVNYGGEAVFNQALIIEVKAFFSNELRELFQIKEKEYANLLGIPVCILFSNSEEVKVEELKYANRFLDKRKVLKKYPKFLPLGSVVLLKKAYKKLMIVGYTPVDLEKKDKIYDYLGCIYPEGMIVSNYNVMFNHNDIDMIFAVGMKDDENQEFLEELKEFDQDKDKKREVIEILDQI